MLELAGILVLGVFAQWLAWRVRIPAILPLIVLGLIIGPFSTFFTPDGEKLLDGDAIFNGELLFSFVALSVGVILFEGGLTLSLLEIRKQAGVVWKILTIGVLVTWVGGTLGSHFLMDLNWRMALLFGALIIVSGPTVVIPILRNVRPLPHLHTILKWEGILIDPLGALLAVLAFEFVRTTRPDQEFTSFALKEFFLTLATGVFLGLLGAGIVYYLLKRNLLPHYLKNVVTLGLVILFFSFSELIMHESGLLTVTIMGMVLANTAIEDLKQILSFKEDVSLILISVLFILLSSRIDLEQLNQLGVNSLLLFLLVIFLIRPLGIFLSTLGSSLKFREKIFLSWVGPRGIVAAAVASLFSLDLVQDTTISEAERAEADLLLPLVFLIIIGTVVIQGSTAKPLARWLKVNRREPQGVLLLGAHEAARFIGRFLTQQGIPVILADTARNNIEEARRQGLNAFEGNLLKDEYLDEIDLTEMGRLLALTSNTEVNMLACKRLEKEFGSEEVYRLVSRKETEAPEVERPRNILFDGHTDFINFIQTVRARPQVKEEQLEEDTNMEEILEKSQYDRIPLFIRKASNKRMLVVANQRTALSKGDVLLYIEKVEKQLPAEETAAPVQQ